jgi:hypothetical protein
MRRAVSTCQKRSLGSDYSLNKNFQVTWPSYSHQQRDWNFEMTFGLKLLLGEDPLPLLPHCKCLKHQSKWCTPSINQWWYQESLAKHLSCSIKSLGISICNTMAFKLGQQVSPNYSRFSNNMKDLGWITRTSQMLVQNTGCIY